MIKDTSGPAFPTAPDIGVHTGETGMTLRDYFAAKALQGLLAQSQGSAFDSHVDVGACWAYQMADAMLKVREQ